jgi:hypothetical protein
MDNLREKVTLTLTRDSDFQLVFEKALSTWREKRRAWNNQTDFIEGFSMGWIARCTFIAEDRREAFVAGTKWAWDENRHRATRSWQADTEALRHYPNAALKNYKLLNVPHRGWGPFWENHDGLD